MVFMNWQGRYEMTEINGHSVLLRATDTGMFKCKTLLALRGDGEVYEIIDWVIDKRLLTDEQIAAAKRNRTKTELEEGKNDRCGPPEK